MAFFGGQPKTAPAMESQTDGARREGEDIPELPEPRSNTVIAKDLIVTGQLRGEGVVQIEGTVEGEVNLKGYVIVTPTGRVKGPVEADVIRVAGQVEGNLVDPPGPGAGVHSPRGGSGALRAPGGGRLSPLHP